MRIKESELKWLDSFFYAGLKKTIRSLLDGTYKWQDMYEDN